MFEGRKKKQRPPRLAPLRLPGQSLDEEIGRLIEKWDDLMVPLAGLIVVTGLEWYRYYYPFPNGRWVFTICTVAIGFFVVRKVLRLRNDIRDLKRGREGEIAVGRQLDELMASGFKVIHDIKGNGWNVDHVVVGKQGVFVVETKNIAKHSPSAKITWRGPTPLIGGFAPDRNPIEQVEAATKAVRDIIAVRTDLKLQRDCFRPVLLYPGWYIDPVPKGVPAWVLTPAVFKSWLADEREKLPPGAVERIAACLEDCVRSAPRS